MGLHNQRQQEIQFLAHGKLLLRSGELSGGYGSTQKVARHAWYERH